MLAFPFPSWLPENDIHATLLTADHTQPVGAVTETVPVVALPLMETLVGEIV
jgi:hypothetical protein